jgi:cytoskeleton protein RodZ
MPRDDRNQTKLAMTMADDRQADFGTFLRHAREQRGVSLQQLAITTKISARVLEALERNDPGRLPGGLFSRAFVRSYAREVGLDPDVVVAKFVSAFPEEAGADEMPATTSAVEAESFEMRRRVVRGLTRLLGAALLVAVIGFIYYSWLGRRPAAAGHEAGLPPAGTAGAVVPGVPQPKTQAPEAAPNVAGRTEPAAAVQAAAPSGAAAATPAAPAPPPPAAPQHVPPQQAPLVVGVTFTDQCWLSVTVDGSRAPSRTVNAGERLEYAVQRSITIIAGNSGALSVTLNGKPARAFGTAGQVVTTTITPSSYESFLR